MLSATDSIRTRSSCLSQMMFRRPEELQERKRVWSQFFLPPMADITLSANSTAAGSECVKSKPSADGFSYGVGLSVFVLPHDKIRQLTNARKTKLFAFITTGGFGGEINKNYCSASFSGSSVSGLRDINRWIISFGFTDRNITPRKYPSAGKIISATIT